MTNIDWPLVLTSATALAAVIGPVISTCVTVRSNERLKREEIHAPKVYAAISQMITAYYKLHQPYDRATYSGWDQDGVLRHNRESYRDFSAACFDVMSLMPDEDIRCQLTDLLKSISSSNYQASADSEASFNKIVSDIAWELSSGMSKHDHSVNRKRKGRKSKDNRG